MGAKASAGFGETLRLVELGKPVTTYVSGEEMLGSKLKSPG
jgi:hypothetical protein